MQQSRASNSGGYRIKKQRNNYLGDGNLKDDEDVFKMSIHSSTNKSPGRGSGNKNKRNNSLANRQNQYERFSNRSKKSNVTRGNISSSSLSGSGKKKEEQGHIKEFANVKQLLMIKAYDKKLFRKVTGSNEANKNFLKLGDVRNDPFRKQTFKVMIQNFKEITIRIRVGYERVLNRILFQNTDTSAIVTLANVQPMLQKVREEADIMHYKVKECLQTHDSRQFRSLLTKFETFLNASSEIQEIILIVSESKNKIDDLFKDLEKDKNRNLEEKVNHQRKKGLKKVRNAVRDYGDDCVEAKILDKVQSAINQMADKTLEAYSKINGVRGLMMRIKECLKQNKDFYELDDIVRLNKIFKEVLNEAENYQRFADHFMEEGDIINDDLRQCILRYRDEVETNKVAVQTMQIKFISNIIETSIQSFEANYSVCNAVDSTLSEDNSKVENLLESVCSCVSEQNVKVTIKAMLRDTGSHFKNLERLIKKLQKIPKSIAIDTEHGLETLTKVSSLIDDYKKGVREIMDREDRAHREITKKRVRRQLIDETDLEQSCIQDIITVSKKLNNSARKQQIEDCTAFKMLKENVSVLELASEIGDLKVYNEFKALQKEIQDLNHKNELGTLIQELKAEEKVYEISPFLVQVYQICISTTESNLLKNLETLNSKCKPKLKQNLLMVELFVERAFAVAICKGLDKKTIKKIDNNRLIEFPENQHDVESLKRDIKYLKAVASLMPQVYAKDRVNLAFIAMEQLMEGIRIAEDLKWNRDGHYYVDSGAIFKLIQESFERCFKFKEKVEVDDLLKKLKNIGHSLDKLERKEKNSGYHETRVEKILQIIHKYETINKKMTENVKKIQNLQAFEGYSQLVFHCCDYLKSTLQSFYGTVNKSGSIFWIKEQPKEAMKLSLFGQSIGLSQLKAGESVQKYNQKCGIKVRKEKPKPKPEPKQKQKKTKAKAKNDDEMGEQIEDNEEIDEVGDEMGEEINDQQEMQEDMEEDMQQDMEEEMQDQMEDQIPDGSMAEEMIVQADENIIDDFEEKSTEIKKNKNRPSAAKNKDHPTINTTNRPESSLKNSNPPVVAYSPKKQEEAIVIKEKKFKTVLEMFKYIETLEDLEEILKRIGHLKANFWGSTDLKPVQLYFNKEGKAQIEKLLAQELQKFCKAQFPSQFIPSIKESESHKSILKEIEDLSLLKFNILCQILALNHKIYSCLMGTNKELIRLSVKDNEKWHSSHCVESYIKKELGIGGIKEEDFEKQKYIEQLIKTKKDHEVRYELGDKNMLLRGQELKQKSNEYEKVIKQYQQYSKFPDGLKLQETILKIWSRFTQKEDEQALNEVPEKFHKDLKSLSTMQNFSSGLYYIKPLREQAKKTIESMQKHGKKLQKLFKDLNKQNLLETIKELITIYHCEPAKVIYFQNHPIMYKEPSQKPEQRFKIICLLLMPQKSNALTSENLRTQVKSKPQIYAEHRTEINRVLSLLSVQSHIWASPTALYINENRDDLIKIIVNYISNGIIKDCHEEVQNLQEVNDSLKVLNQQSLIFEYVIKEGRKLMSNEYNQLYYKELKKVMDDYKKKIEKKLDPSDSVFESLFGMEDTEDSMTTQIFEFTETISLLLKEKVFTEELGGSIFAGHIPTQNKIQEFKNAIDSEVRLLFSIVEYPIEINIAEPLKTFEQMDKKNESIIQWFKENKKKDPAGLSQVKICPCLNSECKNEYTLYIGESKNRIQDYLKKLTTDSTPLESFIKKHQKKSGNSETIHLEKIFNQICAKLTQKDSELIRDFIDQYNLVHIIKKETKNKALADLYGRLMKLNSIKIELTRSLNQISGKVKNNLALFKVLNEKIHSLCHLDLTQIAKDNEEERAKLTEIKVDKTEYTKFGNWVVFVAGKIYKFPFHILIDKENASDVVCIIPGNTDDEAKKELKTLQLPTDFTVVEAKHSYKKIRLNEQYFTVKLDPTLITTEELGELEDENFGLKGSEERQNETWALGIYRKIKTDTQEDQYLLKMASLNDKLLNESKKIEININQFETKADIELKIVEVKSQKGEKISEDNILRQLKSERHTSVNLNDSVCASSLSKWLKSELTKLKEKRRAEEEKLFLLQQQKEKEEEEARRKEQEEKEKKQKEAQFLLAQEAEASSKTIRQEAEQYLDKLYEELAHKNVYIPSKQKLQGKKEKAHELKQPLISQKNIEIKAETEKAISKVEQSLEEEIKNQFHKIAQNYLECVEDLIHNRDEVLKQVLLKSKTGEINPYPNINEGQMKHLSAIMEEISKMPGYDPALKLKIQQILRDLSEQKKEIIESIYVTHH